jgi:PAS domain S-box-containing protein
VLHASELADTLKVSNLVAKIAQASDLRDLARTVVTDLAHLYGFDNTAIFKINALPQRERFELLAQEVGFKDGTWLPATYTQPLNVGLLGLAYEREKLVVVNDVNDGSEDAKHYHKMADEIRSELCIPIWLFGRILWILNVEDRRVGAFLPIDIETLEGVIRQMQVTLDHMFQRDILFQILDTMPDAMVLVEQKGIIVRANHAADRMLGPDPKKRMGRKLADFFLDPEAKHSFAATGAPPSMTTVTGAHGKETPVLVSKFTLPEEYDHVVMILRDVTKLEWKADFEGLKTALAETTTQVRVPVSLLASYVQQIEHRVADDKVRDLTRKAMRQLGRIELTYDRVLALYDDRGLPPAQKVRLDLTLALDHVLSELPQLEREAVRLRAGDASALAVADPYRVLFVLSSMLAYLLRARTKSPRTKSAYIVVSVRERRGTVEVAMTGEVKPAVPRGALAELIERTRAQIALGEVALARMAQECAGSFERRPQANGRERLSLRLPQAH